jgi:hypothetical protein
MDKVIIQMKADEAMPIIQAVVMYWYNTDPMDIMERVYDSREPAYLGEKVSLYKLGFTTFWGQIDFKHQQRFVVAALEKYGDEAERRAEFNRSMS